jgi:hypothetical protein
MMTGNALSRRSDGQPHVPDSTSATRDAVSGREIEQIKAAWANLPGWALSILTKTGRVRVPLPRDLPDLFPISLDAALPEDVAMAEVEVVEFHTVDDRCPVEGKQRLVMGILRGVGFVVEARRI